MNRARIAACAIVILGWATALRGQTAEGDILRGQGVFLEGAGLYRLYSAEGRSIDADTLTWRSVERAVDGKPLPDQKEVRMKRVK